MKIMETHKYWRNHTGLNIIDWAEKGIDLGLEKFCNCIDNEGTRKGFDIELIKVFQNF